MAKSDITKYYEERMRYRLTPEPPTAEEALDAIDFDKGIELIERLQTISTELNEWLHEYLTAIDYTNIPRWQQGLDTLRPIQRLLNENRTWMASVQRNFGRWKERQSNIPNIIYKVS